MNLRRTRVEERFLAKTDKSGGADACWLWTGALVNGYGVLTVHRGKWKNAYAHRLAWELSNGPIPHGMQVCHKCDNPVCVNTAHLFLGTNLDNLADKFAKGRQASGERQGSSKLHTKDVRTIRHLYFAERRTQREIGKFFDVSQATVSLICCGINWRSS